MDECNIKQVNLLNLIQKPDNTKIIDTDMHKVPADSLWYSGLLLLSSNLEGLLLLS